jgi:ParB family transcriptional regulator, chromosome partitioning protein
MSTQPLGPDRDRMSAAMVAVDRIRMHPRNIRRVITGIDELAASIRHKGVIEPLVAHRKYLRNSGQPDLELIAGHRRLAAAEVAGLRRVPVFIVPRHTDDEAILAMLAENTARVEVPSADLGRAVATLREEFGYGSQQIAERLGITVDELQAWQQGRGAVAVPRAAASASRSPASAPARRTRRDVGRPSAPRIRPIEVLDLLAQRDAGEVDDAGIVERLRDWIGDWRPIAKGAAS